VHALNRALSRPVGELWTMQSGYAPASQPGLEAISERLATLTSDRALASQRYMGAIGMPMTFISGKM